LRVSQSLAGQWWKVFGCPVAGWLAGWLAGCDCTNDRTEEGVGGRAVGCFRLVTHIQRSSRFHFICELSECRCSCGTSHSCAARVLVKETACKRKERACPMLFVVVVVPSTYHRLHLAHGICCCSCERGCSSSTKRQNTYIAQRLRLVVCHFPPFPRRDATINK
jgi:hypothetical protein